MKTFSEFIAEAENASSQIAALRAQARQAMQRGDMEKFKELNIQAGELQAGTQARIGAVSNSDKPKTSSNPNSITGGGYPQVGKSKHGRINPDDMPGQRDIRDPRDDSEARSDTKVGSRYIRPVKSKISR
jgi:hypothetical protein